MIYTLYRGLTSVSAPALRLWADHRLKKSKEDPQRMTERFGQASQPRPEGKVIWVHAASVGESLSVLPLLSQLQQQLPHVHFLITTGTVTSAEAMAKRLPEGMIHQYVPWDQPGWVDRFMAHWQPDAVLWLESELWPNMLAAIRKAGIPSVLINGRISPTSARNWSRFRGFARQMLSGFDLVLAGARDYARSFETLGARNVRYVGNLKMGAPKLSVDADALQSVQAQVNGRPCISFLQTHPGEELEFARLMIRWRKKNPDLLGIIVPRHHTRGSAIQMQLTGYATALRSAHQEIGPQTQMYIADTMGEMGLWYSLCPIAVIGGSFIPHGGQNPFEGTHFGAAVLYGPYMFNFPEMEIAMEEAGVAQRVSNWDVLYDSVAHYMDHPQELAKQQELSRHFAQHQGDVTTRFADAIIGCVEKAVS